MVVQIHQKRPLVIQCTYTQILNSTVKKLDSNRILTFNMFRKDVFVIYYLNKYKPMSFCYMSV